MKLDIDWNSVEQALRPSKPAVLDFSVVGAQFTKVAFDVYKRTGEDALWELREAEDGRKILVALYDEGEAETVKTASASEWTAHADSSNQFVTLAFQGSPVYRFSSKDHGFDEGTAAQFANYVVAQAKQPEFIEKMAFSLTPARRAHLLDLVRNQRKTND
jgi:hypothetical protein